MTDTALTVLRASAAYLLGACSFSLWTGRWLVDNRFKETFVSVFLHPLGLSFLFLAAFCAVFRRTVGAGVRWKERVYSRESSVE